MTEHAPSLARAIAQDAKRGAPMETLARRARAIPDPYHAAWALAHVAVYAAHGKEATRLLDEFSVSARRVAESWHRAELLVEAARPLLGEALDDELRAKVRDVLLALVATLEPGAALSSAVRALALRLDAKGLLAEARRGGDLLEDGKAVVAGFAQSKPDAATSAAFVRALHELADPDVAARLFGHLHLQAGRAGLRVEPPALDAAVASARRVPDEDRGETLRVLSLDAQGAAELERVLAAAPETPADRGRLLCAVAAQADRLGAKEQSVEWFLEAAREAEDVADAKRRRTLFRNAAQGLRRLGKTADADRLQALSESDAPANRPTLATKGEPKTTQGKFAESDESAEDGPVEPDGLEAPEQPEQRAENQEPMAGTTSRATTSDGPRLILALHNAYDGSLDKPHIQAVARAAPLAVAFGFDLALVGFPTEDAADIVRRVEAATKVGEGGGFATRLQEEERILLVARTHHGQPHRWGIADAYVATTQSPDAAKPTDLAALAAQGTTCVIMGLGSRGLPKQLLDAAPHHLELTGSGMPLETATVMGVIAERLGRLRAT